MTYLKCSKVKDLQRRRFVESSLCDLFSGHQPSLSTDVQVIRAVFIRKVLVIDDGGMFHKFLGTAAFKDVDLVQERQMLD